jgi:hypothetical protein
MSKLKELTTILKPFVDLPNLNLRTDANELNQITRFTITCNGATLEVEVIDMDIEGAWHQVEAFVAQQKIKGKTLAP